MLDFSLGKFLVLVLIIVVVWYGFKYVQRVDEIRRVLRSEMNRRRQEAAPRGRSKVTEDLVKCQRCGAYVASGSRSSCGRGDCPWGV
jgi:hypothetical protein